MTNYLDLTQDVSDEDYRRVLNALLEQFEWWRQERGWCTDLYLFVGQLTPTYRWDRYAEQMKLDIPEDITGARRAQDLREIRGRILRMTSERSDYITLDKANQFLASAGLAPYTAENPPGTRFEVRVRGYLTSELTERQLQDKLDRYFRRLGSETVTVTVSPAPAPRAAVPPRETVALINEDRVRRAGY